MKYKTLFAILIFSIILTRILAAFNHLPLFADGSYFFISILEDFSHSGMWAIKDDGDHPRLFVNVINQMLLNLGLLAGEVDLQKLAVLFSLPLLILPISLILYFTIYAKALSSIQKSVQLLALASFALLCLSSEVFAVNPALLAIVLSWAFIYLLSSFGFGKKEIVGMILLGGLLFRAHELTIITGYSAFLWGGLLFRTRKNPLHLFFGIFAATFASFNLIWFLTQDLDKAKSNFLADFLSLADPDLFRSSFLISIAGVVSLLGVYYVKAGRKIISRSLLLLPLVVVIVLILLPTETVHPHLEFEFRVLIAVAAMMTSVLPLFTLLNINIPPMTDLAKMSLLITVLAFSLWQVHNSFYWRTFTSHIAMALHERTGLIESTSLSIPTPAERFNWGFTWPSLSIVYGPRPLKALILPKKSEIKIDSDTVDIPFRSFSKSTAYWTIEL